MEIKTIAGLRPVMVLAAAALAVSLAGCGRPADRIGLEGKSGAAAPRSGEPQPAEQEAAAGSASPAASADGSAASAAEGTNPTAQADSTGNAAAIMGGAVEQVDDRSIAAQVSAALAADRELKGLKIDADSQNGVVTLSGVAPTASAKAHADEVTRTVHGVVSVNNQLTLPSG